MVVFGREGKFGKCEWEHEECNEYQDDMYDLYEMTEFGETGGCRNYNVRLTEYPRGLVEIW